MLILSIHVTDIKFSEAADSVVRALMELLGDSNNPSALTFHVFITYLPCLTNSEVVEKFPHLRQTIFERLIQTSAGSSGSWVRSRYWHLSSSLLDEANGSEEPDGNTNRKKDEKPKPEDAESACGSDVCTESAYTGTTTAKPPFKNMFPLCFGVIFSCLSVSAYSRR